MGQWLDIIRIMFVVHVAVIKLFTHALRYFYLERSFKLTTFSLGFAACSIMDQTRVEGHVFILPKAANIPYPRNFYKNILYPTLSASPKRFAIALPIERLPFSISEI